MLIWVILSVSLILVVLKKIMLILCCGGTQYILHYIGHICFILYQMALNMKGAVMLFSFHGWIWEADPQSVEILYVHLFSCMDTVCCAWHCSGSCTPSLEDISCRITCIFPVSHDIFSVCLSLWHLIWSTLNIQSLETGGREEDTLISSLCREFVRDMCLCRFHNGWLFLTVRSRPLEQVLVILMLQMLLKRRRCLLTRVANCVTHTHMLATVSLSAITKFIVHSDWCFASSKRKKTKQPQPNCISLLKCWS